MSGSARARSVPAPFSMPRGSTMSSTLTLELRPAIAMGRIAERSASTNRFGIVTYFFFATWYDFRIAAT
jgi:hypothetical protein